jgi:hypothetical protein
MAGCVVAFGVHVSLMFRVCSSACQWLIRVVPFVDYLLGFPLPVLRSLDTIWEEILQELERRVVCRIPIIVFVCSLASTDLPMYINSRSVETDSLLDVGGTVQR